MDLQKASELLKSAHNIKQLEFYAYKPENKSPVLNCRIFQLGMDIDYLNNLCDQLNSVIQPILVDRSKDLIDDAKILIE